MDRGILGFGVILSLIGAGWLFFASAFYGDSQMSYAHSIIYSVIALLILALGIYVIIKASKERKKD